LHDPQKFTQWGFFGLKIFHLATVARIMEKAALWRERKFQAIDETSGFKDNHSQRKGCQMIAFFQTPKTIWVYFGGPWLILF
jgi:hypothetical protein